MKNIILFALACLSLSSCSNMKSDAEKACDVITQSMEMVPRMLQVTLAAELGDEEAQKELDELEARFEKIEKELESIKAKYDEEEFQACLVENCAAAKKLSEMSDAFQDLGEELNETMEYSTEAAVEEAIEEIMEEAIEETMEEAIE